MRVWVDITNSPHVLFFRPLLRLLAEDGHDVEVTAREYAQTLELLELNGIAHQVVGPRHGGAGAFGKARAMVGRLPALRRFAKGRRFDLALAHGSHEPMLVARSLGIPGATAHDYEFATTAAPARSPGCDAGGLPRRRSTRPPRSARCKAAEAASVPGDRGGVLPRGLRTRPGRPRRHRSRERARRRADAAGGVALPPPRQPALPGRARPARPRRARARSRPPANGASSGRRSALSGCRRCTCRSTRSTLRALSVSPTSSSRPGGR